MNCRISFFLFVAKCPSELSKKLASRALQKCHFLQNFLFKHFLQKKINTFSLLSNYLYHPNCKYIESTNIKLMIQNFWNKHFFFFFYFSGFWMKDVDSICLNWDQHWNLFKKTVCEKIICENEVVFCRTNFSDFSFEFFFVLRPQQLHQHRKM